jgi:hypothetical protein
MGHASRIIVVPMVGRRCSPRVLRKPRAHSNSSSNNDRCSCSLKDAKAQKQQQQHQQLHQHLQPYAHCSDRGGGSRVAPVVVLVAVQRCSRRVLRHLHAHRHHVRGGSRSSSSTNSCISICSPTRTTATVTVGHAWRRWSCLWQTQTNSRTQTNSSTAVTEIVASGSGACGWSVVLTSSTAIAASAQQKHSSN